MPTVAVTAIKAIGLYCLCSAFLVFATGGYVAILYALSLPEYSADQVASYFALIPFIAYCTLLGPLSLGIGAILSTIIPLTRFASSRYLLPLSCASWLCFTFWAYFFSDFVSKGTHLGWQAFALCSLAAYGSLMALIQPFKPLLKQTTWTDDKRPKDD
jgi:hypothetical protein